jgi:hypothetical protein
MDAVSALIATIASPAIQGLLKSAVGALTDKLSSNTPLPEAETPRLTDLDRRMSMGLTKRDGTIALALLIEKPDSLAERKADELVKRFGKAIIPTVTGIAHSSRVDDPIPAEFEPRLGASLSHIRGAPGSIGCLVKTKSRGNDFLALTSASHVLSMLNNAEKGDKIICPGHPDGPRVLDNMIGTLWNFTYLNHHTEKEGWANLLNHEDIAVVKLVEPEQWPDANLVPNPSEPSKKKKVREVVERGRLLDYLGTKVFKIGRSTGLTRGTFEVAAIQQSPIRLPDGKVYMYRDLFAIKGESSKPFTMPGDSGALVYTEDFKALGFVVGGSESHTFVCSAEECLKSTKATLV